MSSLTRLQAGGREGAKGTRSSRAEMAMKHCSSLGDIWSPSQCRRKGRGCYYVAIRRRRKGSSLQAIVTVTAEGSGGGEG